MKHNLILLIILYTLAGAIVNRILYITLYLEGAILSAIYLFFISGTLTTSWLILLLTTISVIRARVGLALVVKYTRSQGNDHVKST